MKHTVFVYGSLMRGLGNSGWLRGATFAGHANLQTRDLQMVSLGGFPALVQRSASQPLAPEDLALMIHGEAYEVDDEGLSALDMLEGHPRFYRRRLLHVRVGAMSGQRDWVGPRGKAWVYVLDRPADWHETVVESLDGRMVSWRWHLDQRRKVQGVDN